MYSKEEAYSKIAELVERFSEQVDNYKRDYNETQTRQDFINPFFEALGWDMNNKQGAWEAYREVIHEDKLKVGGVTKAPDYSFRLVGGQRLFFVEAKKPSIVIKDDEAPAYQVRLYGWNAKLAISVVTDFEEFAVYECSKKPLKTDKASKARINYFTYKDYLKEFDFFWNTFSKQQVIKGGLIKFQQADKKGTATVDKDFLESLDVWRKELAANIYKNNGGINEDELNYAVQQTIDRIIFLRIAEDRGLEPYGQLKSSLQNDEQYKELFRQFRIADDKYNSGLFHFKKEKDNSKEPDNISGKLIIENKVIKSIISSLYPPQSEFLFNVMPVEILGSAYEQFLGKQIIVKGSRATIEEKPEVRKAGGVYYTPQYIVEYIVENTVGKLCNNKTPKEISKLKIVDPACGSGSFLLGAYQYLLNWHSRYYTANPQKSKQKDAVLTPDGSLTTAEKKRILLNNIYGVDIDRNATEVTKLSLLLKCMEGETSASVNTQMTFFHERILPSLENNIKSGNSLIDVDFYDTQLDFGEEKKIKPFSWQQGFPEVFKQGGFDVVIGNPPYGALFIQTEKNYLDKHFSVSQGNYESFSFFIQKGIFLLKQNALLGYIIPDTWFMLQSSYKLRKFIIGEVTIQEIQMLNENVFKNVKVDVCTIILSNQKSKNTFPVYIYDKDAKDVDIATRNYLKMNSFSIQDIKNEKELSFKFHQNKRVRELLLKISSTEITLSNFCLIGSGCKPYEVGKGIPSQTKLDLEKRTYTSNYQKDSSYRIMVRGADIGRYKNLNNKNEWIKYGKCLAAPRNPELFNNPRLVFQSIRNPKLQRRLIGTYIDDNSVNNNSLTNIILKTNRYSLKFFLALLNSELFNWYFSLSYNIVNIDPRYLKMMSIVEPAKKNHEEIVSLVDIMLQLNKEKQQTTTPDKLVQLNTRIQYTDDKINKLVYQLYGLSEEEIGIVEGK